MEWVIGNLTYILIGCQYLVRDMLKLRALAITASLCSMYFMFFKELYNIVLWNLFFLAVNVVQLTILILERRPVHFSAEEQQLRDEVFASLEDRDVRRLLDLAEWREAGPGELLVEANQPLDDLLLVAGGTALVKVEGRVVGEVKKDYFVGEMSYLTGAVASARVEVSLPCRYLRWSQSQLQAYLGERASLRYGFQGVLGLDLTRKIRKADGLQTTAGTVPLAALTQHG